MSTPATIILKNHYHDGSEVEVARFYRHWDGYVSRTGGDIALALQVAARTKPHGDCDPQLTNHNWAQHFLRAFCAIDAEIELVDAGRVRGSEFTYEIIGDYGDFGGKQCIDERAYLKRLRIKVRRDDFELFCGGAPSFIDFTMQDQQAGTPSPTAAGAASGVAF